MMSDHGPNCAQVERSREGSGWPKRVVLIGLDLEWHSLNEWTESLIAGLAEELYPGSTGAVSAGRPTSDEKLDDLLRGPCPAGGAIGPACSQPPANRFHRRLGRGPLAGGTGTRTAGGLGFDIP